MSDGETGQYGDGTQYEDPDDSVCTEFDVVEDLHNEDGEKVWAWSFECTRCGHMTPCKGDPRGFGGRPYSCQNCGWVSLLDQDEIQSFAEEHYVDTGTDRNGGDDIDG